MSESNEIEKAPRNRYPRRPPLERIIAAVNGTGGIHVQIAKKLGVSRNTVAVYIKDYPEVAEAIQAETERILDGVESRLIDNALNGDMSAVSFYLRCKGRGRGYNDRVDSHISGSLTISKPPPSLEEIAKARQEILDMVAEDV